VLFDALTFNPPMPGCRSPARLYFMSVTARGERLPDTECRNA
jgi:hypothetical protein